MESITDIVKRKIGNMEDCRPYAYWKRVSSNVNVRAGCQNSDIMTAAGCSVNVVKAVHGDSDNCNADYETEARVFPIVSEFFDTFLKRTLDSSYVKLQEIVIKPQRKGSVVLVLISILTIGG